MSSKGRLAKEQTVHGTLRTCQGCRTIGTHASEIHGIEVFTVGRMSCAAGAAETAAREAQKDVVARLDACDASSHLLNYAGSLMSQDERQLGRDDCVTAGH